MVEAQVDANRNIRNETIEEVAKEIEKMTVFGKDTLDSFTIFIRNLKTKEWTKNNHFTNSGCAQSVKRSAHQKAA